MSTISRIPASHGSLTFSGPNLDRDYSVTLASEFKWSPTGVVFDEIPDVHGVARYMGKTSYGKIKFTPVADQDLTWLRDMRAATATWVSIGRTMTFNLCILIQGDALPETNLVTGLSDELIVAFTTFAQELKTDN
jgi:hypothetical protein